MKKVEQTGTTHPDLPYVNMVLQVHDELIFEVPEKELEGAKRLVKTVMEATGWLGPSHC